MQNGVAIIIGFILGNDAARKWCFDQCAKASQIIESEFKKTKKKNNEPKETTK